MKYKQNLMNATERYKQRALEEKKRRGLYLLQWKEEVGQEGVQGENVTVFDLGPKGRAGFKGTNIRGEECTLSRSVSVSNTHPEGGMSEAHWHTLVISALWKGEGGLQI